MLNYLMPKGSGGKGNGGGNHEFDSKGERSNKSNGRGGFKNGSRSLMYNFLLVPEILI
jgi:hypothetical protein